MLPTRVPRPGETPSWTGAERAAWDQMLEARAAMAIGSSTTGGAMVPTDLDPTIILTNAGSSNVIRNAAREVTITAGNVWHGVSSDGVTISWDSEGSEVSDDSPTLAAPSITAHQAQGLVRGSVQVWDDAVTWSPRCCGCSPTPRTGSRRPPSPWAAAPGSPRVCLPRWPR